MTEQTQATVPPADAPPNPDDIEAGVLPNPDADDIASAAEEMTGEDARSEETAAAARVTAARSELDEALKEHSRCLKVKKKVVKKLTLAEINAIQKKVNLNEQKTRLAPANYARSQGMVLQTAPVSGRRTPLVNPNPSTGKK